MSDADMAVRDYQRLVADIALVTDYIIDMLNERRPMLTADIYSAALNLQRYARDQEELL